MTSTTYFFSATLNKKPGCVSKWPEIESKLKLAYLNWLLKIFFLTNHEIKVKLIYHFSEFKVQQWSMKCVYFCELEFENKEVLKKFYEIYYFDYKCHVFIICIEVFDKSIHFLKPFS